MLRPAFPCPDGKGLTFFLCCAMLTTQGNTESGGSSAVWAAGLNKTTGCNSPRCRRCKCRDSLPLTKVSHWFYYREGRQGNHLRHKSEDLPDFCCSCFFPCSGGGGRFVSQEYGCGGIGNCHRSRFTYMQLSPNCHNAKTDGACHSVRHILRKKIRPAGRHTKKEMTLDDFCSRFLRQGSSLFCLII